MTASLLSRGLPDAARTPWAGTPAPGPGRRVSSLPASPPASPALGLLAPPTRSPSAPPRPPLLTAPLPPRGWSPTRPGRGRLGLTCSSVSCLPNCLPSATEPWNFQGAEGSAGRPVSPSVAPYTPGVRSRAGGLPLSHDPLKDGGPQRHTPPRSARAAPLRGSVCPVWAPPRPGAASSERPAPGTQGTDEEMNEFQGSLARRSGQTGLCGGNLPCSL